jgi:hypothetical protein
MNTETSADSFLSKEEREHRRLLRLWATGRATRKQIDRCMELDRREANRPASPDFGVAAERCGGRSPAVKAAPSSSDKGANQ